MFINFLCENAEFQQESFYTIKVLGICLGVKVNLVEEVPDSEEPLIYYGNKQIKRKNTICIIPGELFTRDYGAEKSICKWNGMDYKNIPFLFGTENVQKIDDVFVTTIDIIQSAFYILTGYEEWVDAIPENWDMHGRYRAECKAIYSMCKMERPLVNEYAQNILGEWLNSFGYSQDIKRELVLNLTHDVDYPFGQNKVSFVRRVNNFLRWKLLSEEPKRELDNGFSVLRDIEKKYGVSSSWYFKTGGNSIYDMMFDFTADSILRLADQLKKQKCEIGYHYSYNAACDKHLFSKEKNKFIENFNEKNIGGRNHYLRKVIPDSISLYETEGIIYDSTMGSAMKEGFSQGICTPYPLFHLEQKRISTVWEIPLLIMDGTLQNVQYRNMTMEDAIEASKRILQQVKAYNGVYTVLWHNTSVSNDVWRGWEQVYDAIIENAVTAGAVSMTGKEIIDYYQRLFL